MAELLVEGRVVKATSHALARYGERVAASFSRRSAREQLEAVSRHAKFGDPPDWVDDPGKYAADEWVLLTDDICLPVSNGWAVTTLTRGGSGDEYQAHRRRSKRVERQRRRGARDTAGRRSKRGGDYYRPEADDAA